MSYFHPICHGQASHYFRLFSSSLYALAFGSDHRVASPVLRYVFSSLNLSSEALEEFLSILRPSLFTPASPTFRARRNESCSGLAVPLERPHTFRLREGSHNKSPSLSSGTAEDRDTLPGADDASIAFDHRQGGDNDHPRLWRIPGILGKQACLVV